MKSLFLGIFVILLLGIGGLVYQNAVEYPTRQVACPLDALVCPDGTAISRTGLSCTFPVCPPPNISLPDINISFALPEGFTTGELSDASGIAAFDTPSGSSIIIRRYAIQASSTALVTIQQTAVNNPSGLPVSATSFSSTVLGGRRFTVVSLERFEGVVNTAYYLARAGDVLRFDAIDRNVMNWTDANADLSTLPARVALEKLLATLQGQ